MRSPTLSTLPEGPAGVSVRTVLANLADRLAAASSLGDWRSLVADGGPRRLSMDTSAWTLGPRPPPRPASLPLLLPMRVLLQAMDDDPSKPGYAVRLPGNGFWSFGPERPRWPRARVVACSQLVDHLDRVMVIQRLPGERVAIDLDDGEIHVTRGGGGGLAVGFVGRAQGDAGPGGRIAHWIDAVGILMATDATPAPSRSGKPSGMTLPPFAAAARTVAGQPGIRR